MNDIKHVGLIMASNGRVVIPSAIRAELGCENGGKLIARMEDGVLILEPYMAAVRRAQALVRKYVPEGRSLVDELIADRRAEAERE